MQQSLCYVEDGRLYQPLTGDDPIVVGTPSWFDWLKQHATFTFVDYVGAFTAYRRNRHAIWEALDHQAYQLSRIQLGPTHTLTLAHLQAATRTLAAQRSAGESPEALGAQPAESDYLLPRIAAQLSTDSALLRTKLFPPRLISDAIPRPRLLALLNMERGGRLTLLCAPAGYGKTTLLAQWLTTLSRPVAWLSLNAADNELPSFVHALASALEQAVSSACPASAGLLYALQFPSLLEVVSLLTDELTDISEDVLLVLDDYHLIENEQIHSLLSQLVEHLPPQMHLVISSRSAPPLPLSRWHARGWMNELGALNLRLTGEEAAIFLEGLLGEPLVDEVAVALEKRTEGWAALLRLAMLSLRGSPDRAAFLQRLEQMPDPMMRDYLVEEVLGRLAPARQETLVRLSMLGTFNAELGAATLGSDVTAWQVQELMDEMERTNLFVVPYDERQGWYRFHHLIKQVLEQLLQARVNPEELSGLHQRASSWYARQELIEEAIQHALAADDAPVAARLVEAQFLRAFEYERWVYLQHLLQMVPEEQVQGSFLLLVARTWIAQAHGRTTDFPGLLVKASRLLEISDGGTHDPGGQQHRLQHALIEILWSQFYFMTGQIQAIRRSACSALEWLPSGEKFVAIYATQYLAFSYEANGQEEVALETLRQALIEHSMHLTCVTRLLHAQELVYQVAGKLPQLEQVARHVLPVAQEVGMPICHYWAHWYLGMVYYEWNQLEAAAYHFSLVIANQHHANLLAVQEAMCGLSLTYQAQGLKQEAQATARGLLTWVQDRHNLPQLMTAYAFCAQLALAQGEVEEAQQWLELAGEQELLGPMLFLEDPTITRTQMLLAGGDQESVEHGQELLIELLRHVEAIHCIRKQIKVLALQAWAYHLQGRMSEALAALERALELGRAADFVRTFADLPGLTPLLGELRRHRKADRTLDKQWDSYLQRLLAAMHVPTAHTESIEELMHKEGLEPLTTRELDILRLLEREFTNQQVARELVITPGTVKVHTANLYRKLGVDNRRAAVTLARTLGLLARN